MLVTLISGHELPVVHAELATTLVRRGTTAAPGGAR
jgi:hypothetical protein